MLDDAALRVAALRAGACTAWALLPSEFARAARRRVQPVVMGLGLLPGLVDDLLLGVSELATNAVQHGGTVEHVVFDELGEPVAGLPEVWLYIRQAARTREQELVVTVFDTGEWAEDVLVPTLGHTDAAGEDGRGLQIVAALAAEAGGWWDRHPSRSRLGRSRVPGTAARLALPLPACPQAGPLPVALPAAEAVDRLAAHLTSRGIDGLITNANGVEAHVSCPAGITVWAWYGTYHWRGRSGHQRRPVADLVDVAEAVLAEIELSTRRPRHEEGKNECPSSL